MFGLFGGRNGRELEDEDVRELDRDPLDELVLRADDIALPERDAFAVANEVGAREPEAEAEREQMRPGAEQPSQGAATSFSCSIRAGPMPGMASSSSSELNAPCSWR